MKIPAPFCLAASALALAACVGPSPIAASDDHPASPKAPSGFASSPAAMEEYKTPDDFAARMAEDAKAPAMDHSAHGGMNMPGMNMPSTQAPPAQSASPPATPGPPPADHAH